jgi:hypothetical protein
MERPSTSAALVVIRVWGDREAGGGVRARIIQTLDVETRRYSVVMAGSVDDVCAAVRRWLDEFVDTTMPPNGGDVDGEVTLR